MKQPVFGRGLGVGLAVAALVAAAQEPEVLTFRVATKDAPLVVPERHAGMRQNAWIDWTLVGPGPTEGKDALYLFTSVVREESIEGETPVFSFLDLADGKLTSVYPGSRIRVRESRPALDLDAAVAKKKDDLMDAGEEPAADMNTSWVWGSAISGARASGKAVFLGTDSGETVKPMLLRYYPRETLFEELETLSAPAVGMAVIDGALWYLTRDGSLFTRDDIGGSERKGRLPAGTGPVAGLFMDKGGVLYTRTAAYPFRILVIERAGGGVKVKPLFADRKIESVRFREFRPGPLCELVTATGNGHFTNETFLLAGGKAERVEGKPDGAAFAAEFGYELELEADREPLEAAVRPKGGEWKRLPIVFEKTGRDKIKELAPGPDGHLYGAGWPVAWIFRFEPDTGRSTILGRHYVFYEMLPWKDEMWVCGYWGIKLLRWHPQEPFTFDYDRHYAKKTFPGNTSPWGDKEVSNPRLVCKFRYLKQLNVRRPGGMAIGPDGFAYVGGRTPAVEYFDSRFGGAINWYDPETETIGQIREPFLHHSVRDVCAAGDRYVAAVASQYICMFEPLPTNFSSGKFVLYDTKEKKVALDISPLDAPLSYAEEGEPGRVVVAGKPGRYGGEGIASALFIFDTKALRVTHVIRLPVKIGWAEYNVLPFLRGPDNKIYFYGSDADGTALFRADSVTGKVEPVLRAKGITDVATYNVPGAPFAFFRDRFYSGVHELLSVPQKTVTGEP